MRSGRVIPMNRELRAALLDLHQYRQSRPKDPIISSKRGRALSPASAVRFFFNLYRKLGFTGCSSHSGSRTFITHAARTASMVGGSLRDVMELAGHRSLQITSHYIESDTKAKRKLVQMI